MGWGSFFPEPCAWTLIVNALQCFQRFPLFPAWPTGGRNLVCQWRRKMFSYSAPIQLHPHPLLRRTIVSKSSTKKHHSHENKENKEDCFPVSFHQQKSVKKLLCWASEEKPAARLGARRDFHWRGHFLASRQSVPVSTICTLPQCWAQENSPLTEVKGGLNSP